MSQKQAKVCPSCKQVFKSRPNAITCSNRCRKRLYRTKLLLSTEAETLAHSAVGALHKLEHGLALETATEDGFIQVAEPQAVPAPNPDLTRPAAFPASAPAPQPITPAPPSQGPVQPGPQFDWNRYEAPAPKVNRFAEPSDTLDNATAFKTVPNEPAQTPVSSGAPPFVLPKRRILRYVAVAMLLVIGLAAGNSFWNRPGNSDTNLAFSQKPSSSSDAVQSDLGQATLKINRNTLLASGKSLTASGPIIIQNATGTNLFTADTVNNRVGVGTKPAPTGAVLQVAGDISANGVILGTGGKITLGPDGLRINNTLICSANGCVSSSLPISKPSSATIDVANVAYINQNQTFNGNNLFNAAGNSFTGNGSGLTGLNASNIFSGTLDDNRLSANIARLDLDQTFSGVNTLLNPANQIGGNGSGLTGLNASNLASGTVSDNRLSGNVALLASDQTFSGNNTFSGSTTQTGDYLFKSTVNSLAAFQVQNQQGNDNLLIGDTINTRIGIGVAAPNYTLDINGDVNVSVGHTFRIDGVDICSGGGCTPAAGSAYYVQLQATTPGTAQNGNYNVTGTAIAGTFSGSGMNLTNLDASQLALGTVNDTRLSATVTLQGNTFNGANDLVQLNNSGVFPALNASNLTNLNASNLSSGTVSDTRLSSNVPLINANQTFIGNNTFSGNVIASNIQAAAALTIGTGNKALSLQGDLTSSLSASGNSHTVSLGFAGTPSADIGYKLDTTVAAGTYTICTTIGNCSGAGGGVTSSGGTTNKLAKFTAAQALGDSSISDNGTAVSVAAFGLFQAASNSTTAFQIQNQAATSNLLIADTVNSKVGIAKTPAAAGAALQVGGNLDISGIFSVNGTQISTANLSDGSSLAKVGANQTFTGSNTFSNAGNSFTGNGSGLTNVDAATLGGNNGAYYTNAANLSSGTVNNSRLSAQVARTDLANTFTANNTFQLNSTAFNIQDNVTPLGTTLFAVTNSAGSTNYFSVSATGAKIGTQDVCTTAGNCAGSGTGVTTAGGSINKLAKFTSSQAVGDSIITDNGSTVTIAGTLAVNTITPTATLTVGTPTQTLTLQGNGSTSLSAKNGSITNKLVFAAPTISDKTLTLPDASGTIAVSASGPLALDGAGNLTCPTCLTSGGGGGSAGVSSFNTLTGAITLAGTANQVNLGTAGNVLTLSLPQDIATTSTPTFANVNVTGQFKVGGSQISSANLSNDSNLAKVNGNNVFSGNNTFAGTVLAQNASDSTAAFQIQNQAGSSNLLVADTANSKIGIGLMPSSGGAALQVSGNVNVTGGFTIGGANINTAGTLNNVAYLNNAQTFTAANTFSSASNSFAGNGSGLTSLDGSNISSGTVADNRLSNNVAFLASNNTFAGNNIFSGTITTATVQAAASLTLGTSTKALALQGDLTTNLTATGSGHTITVGFSGTPTGNITYNFDNTATAGTYIICSTAGNCAGVGGGVTTAGGTANRLAKFTASQGIGNSTITDTGTTVSVAGYGVFQAPSNSVTAFQIQDQAGTSNLFIADTSANRIAIGQATAGYKLDVAGDVNVTSGSVYRVNSVNICDNTGCLTRAGGNNYIQNSVALQTSANFNIESTATGSIVAILQGKSGQNADLLQLKDGTASHNIVLSVGSGGAVLAKDYTAGNNAFFQIQNSSNVSLITANTTTGQILLPNANLSSTALLLGGNANLYAPSNGNLKTDNNLAIAGTETVSGNATFNGAVLAQNTSNSATAFQIQNSAGLSLLSADTTNFQLNTTKLQSSSTIASANGTANAQLSWNYQATTGLTMSGNEITDATRLINTQGDGVVPPNSSTGVWEGTTNMVTNGGFESNATGWTANQGGEVLTRVTSDAKFGSASLDVVTPATGLAGAESPTFAATTGLTYTGSLWARSISGTTTAQIRIRVAANSILATSNITLTPTWTRYTVTYTSTVTTALVLDLIQVPATASEFRIDGAQVEQKSIATPYVETNGGTASRSAARVQAQSSIINPTQSWFTARVRMSMASSAVANLAPDNAMTILELNQSAFTDRISLIYLGTSGQFHLDYTKGNVAQSAGITASFNTGDIVTLTGYWTSGTVGLSVNGSAFTTATRNQGDITPATLDIGSHLGSRQQVDGDFLWTAAGTGTLSNTDAAALNNYGNTDPLLSNLVTLNSGAAAPTMVWNGKTAAVQGTSGTAQSSLTLDDTSLYRGSANTLQTNSNFLLQSATNSATAFQVQNASGTNIFSVDTTANATVAITNTALVLTTSAQYGGLVVNGSGQSNGLRLQQSGVPTYAIQNHSNCSFPPYASGGCLGIGQDFLSPTIALQNQVVGINSLNLGVALNVLPGASNIVGETINAASGQSADLLQIKNGSTLLSVGATGAVLAQNSTNSTTALQVQNSSGTNVLSVDTTNQRVSVGANGTATGQLYISGTVPTSALGSVTTGSHPAALAVQGRYAYVVNNVASTLQVFDIANPASPVSVGSVATANAPSSIAVVGRYAYVGEIGSTNASMEIYDVSNPNSPVLKGTMTQVTRSATGGSTYVTIQGRYAYVTVFTNTGTQDIAVIDIANPASPTRVGTVPNTGGWQNPRTAIQGKYIYFTEFVNPANNAVFVVDISNPLSPAVVYLPFGTAATDGNAGGLAVSGRYAYIAGGGQGGLQVFDVSNPASPSIVASVGTGTLYSQIILRGRYAYAANTSNNRVDVYDINTPASPTIVGSFTTGTGPFDIAVSGRYAYVVNNTSNTLQTFDLGGEYAQQLETGGIETGALQVNANAQIQGDETIQGGLSVGTNLQTSGNVAVSGSSFFQGSTSFATGIVGGLSLSGLSNTSAPSVTPRGTAGSTSYGYTITAVSAAGGETLASTAGTTTTGNATLSSTNYNELFWNLVNGAVSYKVYRTVSSGTPSSTGLIGTSTSFKFDDTGLAASGSSPTVNTTGNLSVTGNSSFKPITNSVAAFQVQNSAGSPLLTADTINQRISVGSGGTAVGQLYVSGSLPTSVTGSVATGSSPSSIAVVGRYAYVTNRLGNTLGIYDVSNSSSPTALSTVAINANPQWVSVLGRYAYVVGLSNTLQIVDISNPLAPVVTASVATGSQPLSVYVQGNYAYVVNSDIAASTLQIFDVSNPKAPVVVSTVAASNQPAGIYVQGRYAYVALDSPDSVKVYDVSNPASPQALGSVNVTGHPTQITVQGHYAYVTSYNLNNMQIVDVSNPSSLSVTGSLSTGVLGPKAIAVQGRYAYLPGNSSGTMMVADISTPSAPTSVGIISIAGKPLSNPLYVQGRYAYVLDGSNSQLYVVDVGGEYAQQLEAGGIETSTLGVNSNATIAGDAAINGGVVVGRSLQVSGGLAVGGGILSVDTTNMQTNVGNLQSSGTISLQNGQGASISLRTVSSSSTGLTLSGNEITDASRSSALQGDGRQPPDSSTGIWEGTTNLITNGGFESIATGLTPWFGHLGTETLVRDTSKSKFGTTSLKTTTVGVGGGPGLNAGAAASTTYTFSAWVWVPTGTNVSLQLQDNSGVIVIGSSAAGNNAWQRLTLSGTTRVGANFIAPSVTTSSAGDFWIDGAQLEQKSIATPYVETNGSAVSRSAAKVQAPSSLLSASQGWFAARLRMGFSYNSPPSQTPAVFWWGQSNSNYINLQYRNTGGGPYTWTGWIVAGGTTYTVSSPAQSFSAGDSVSVVLAWTGSTLKVSVNGGAFTSAASATPSGLPVLFSLGSDDYNIASWADSDMKWAAAGTGTLTDADAAMLNAYGNSDPTLSDLATLNSGASQASFRWDGSSTQYAGTNASFVNQSQLSIDDVNLTHTANGSLTVQGATNSTTGFQVLNSGGTQAFGVDTTNMQTNVGNLQSTGSITLQNGQGASIQLRTVSASSTGLTLSGSEITDTNRASALQGDGRQPPDSSTGIWEATTNLITNGGFESNSTGWTSNAGGSPATITRDTSRSKFGVASGRVDVTSSGAFGNISSPVPTLSVGQVYTLSVWVNRTETAADLRIEVRNAANTGNQATVTIPQSLGWQRVTTTFTATDATPAWIRFIIYGSGTPTYYVDGMQIEQKAVTTPYVETNGGTATRSAGRIQAPSSTINMTSGWFTARIRPSWSSSGSMPSGAPGIFEWNNNDSNRLFIYFAAANQIQIYRIGGGSGGAGPSVNLTYNAGDTLTITGYWTSTTLGISVNGAAFTTAGQTTIPSSPPATFDIGSLWTHNAGGGNNMDGDILWSAAGSGTLTNADAAALNAYGNSDPTLSKLNALNSGTSAATFAWDGEASQYTGMNSTASLQSALSLDDATIYRSSASVIKTDGQFTAVGTTTGIGFQYNPATGSGNALYSLVGAEANPRFAIQYNGQLNWGAGGGSGTDTTLYRSAAAILQTNGAFRTGDQIQIGTGLSNNTLSGPGLALSNATGAPTGSATGGGILYVQAGALKYQGSAGTFTTIANADYAESMPVLADVQPGDLVSVSNQANTGSDSQFAPYLLQKSQTSYDSQLIGIVSSPAGATTGGGEQPIAMIGRVPVNVTNENGAIAPGDFLTSSSTPGYAMKATKAGMVIGKALESFNNAQGSVLVLVGTQYYNPAMDLQGSTLDVVNINQANIATLTVTGNATFQGDLSVAGDINTAASRHGANVGVVLGSTQMIVNLSAAQRDRNYTLQITPSWVTAYGVINKTATGFTVEFDKAAPSDATFDWLIIR
jgi:hypothetical protein